MQEAHSSGAPLLRLLFIDNAQTDCGLLVRLIRAGGYAVHFARAESAAQMRDALLDAPWDAVITELDLPGFSLSDVMQGVREAGFDMPVIVVTGTGDEDAAVEALVAGADDCVHKARLARLVPALKRSIAAAAARRRERAEQARLRLLQSHLDHVNEVQAIARDLHHTIGELMAELTTDFRWLAGNATDEADRARARHMQHVLERAGARAERGMRALRSPLLEQGIVLALQTLAQSVLRRQGIAVEFVANRTAITLDEASFFAMYRVCQESVILFARQPHTKSIHIELFAEADAVTLEVADDGLPGDDDGFSAVIFDDLRAAVETLGGSLEISRTPRHGTSVILSLSLGEGA